MRNLSVLRKESGLGCAGPPGFYFLETLTDPAGLLGSLGLFLTH
jgi:hypothetical protein